MDVTVPTAGFDSSVPESATTITSRKPVLKQSTSPVGGVPSVSSALAGAELPRLLIGSGPYLAAIGAAGFAYWLHVRSTPRTAIGVVRQAVRGFSRVLRG